jgi:hypothetical protein
MDVEVHVTSAEPADAYAPRDAHALRDGDDPPALSDRAAAKAALA